MSPDTERAINALIGATLRAGWNGFAVEEWNVQNARADLVKAIEVEIDRECRVTDWPN